MDYEKKYKAVLLTATQWIEDGCTDKERICLECVFPELRESEDERIRKWLIDYFSSIKETVWIHRDITCEQILAYLEKQKEPHYTKRNALFDKCVENCDPEVMKEVSNKVDEMLGKKQKPSCWNSPVMTHEMIMDEQKEQKPTDDKAFEEWIDDWYQGSKEAGGDVVMSEAEFKNWSRGIRNMYANQESAEWSKMDKENIDSLVIILHKALSKGISCEEEVLDLIDWLKSLRPSWKPSEQEKGALRTAICILTEVRKFPKAAKQLQNILDAFEGKKSHKDWKPSEEQKPAWNEKDKKKFERLAFLI